MNIVDLLNAGQDILGAVSNAVDTGDYSRLAGDIQDIAFGGSDENGRNDRGSYPNRQWTYRNGQNAAYGGRPDVAQRRAAAAAPQRNYFMGNPPDRRRSLLCHIGGLVGCVCFLAATVLSALFFAAAGMVGMRPSPLGMLIFAFFVIMAVVCLVVSRKGRRQRRLIERFYTYAGIIGTREYFTIEEVSAASGVKPEQVRKDMKELNEQGVVPYLVMDKSGTTAMLSERMVREYERSEQARAVREEEERRQRQQETERQEAMEKAARSTKKKAREAQKEPEQESELDAVIREGNEAIRTIREINDRIPDDYEMSDKLYRLENIMKRIFERVRKDPARAKDIRKLMNYYLPTTIKLLRAYEEIYDQPSVGDNVQDTRRQIENAMDTINDAFENLLDDLFQDQAWDIASDIDAMKTMMAQDGLVDDGPKERQTVS